MQIIAVIPAVTVKAVAVAAILLTAPGVPEEKGKTQPGQKKISPEQGLQEAEAAHMAAAVVAAATAAQAARAQVVLQTNPLAAVVAAATEQKAATPAHTAAAVAVATVAQEKMLLAAQVVAAVATAHQITVQEVTVMPQAQKALLYYSIT